MPLFKNLAISAVATAPSPATSGTSLVVTSGHGSRFPDVPFMALVCPAATVPDPSNAEFVTVTAISTDTLTITRAQESSSARSIVVGDQIAAVLTADMLAGIVYSKIVTESGTSRTLALADAAKYIRTTNAGAVSITVPPQSSVAWQPETEITFEQAGAGLLTIVAGSGVTINTSATLKAFGQYAVIALKRVSSDVWTLTGERALS